jgi:hypothetical protein
MDNTALMQQLPFAEVVQCVKDMFPKKKREILKINFETLKPKNEVVTKVASDMLSKKKSFIGFRNSIQNRKPQSEGGHVSRNPVYVCVMDFMMTQNFVYYKSMRRDL